MTACLALAWPMNFHVHAGLLGLCVHAIVLATIILVASLRAFLRKTDVGSTCNAVCGLDASG